MTGELARPDIAIFGSFRATGGTYRRLTNQIHVWDRLGYRVDLVAFRDGVMFYADEMPASVRFVHLRTHGKLPTLFALWRYLARERPRVVLSIMHLGNIVLARCARLPGVRSRVFLSVPNTYGESGKAASPMRRRQKFRQIRRLYPRADGVIAVSAGVRRDLVETVGLRGARLHTIYNGSIGHDLAARARAAVDHPWLTRHDHPVFLAAGGLRLQKDFATLLQAFARVRAHRRARLIIIGEGPERTNLEALIDELEIADDVDLPGFVTNPYAWMAKADVFVLSSRWEGLVNVVAEALGVGVPVVATDCPSGPREILADGRYGRLVPMADPAALAAAMEATLDDGGPDFDRREAVQPFTADHAARAYLEAFGLDRHMIGAA